MGSTRAVRKPEASGDRSQLAHPPPQILEELRGLTADGGGPTNTPAIALGRVLGAEQESKEPLRVVVPRGVLLVRLVAGRLREALQEVFGPADLVRDERGAGA